MTAKFILIKDRHKTPRFPCIFSHIDVRWGMCDRLFRTLEQTAYAKLKKHDNILVICTGFSPALIAVINAFNKIRENKPNAKLSILHYNRTTHNYIRQRVLKIIPQKGSKK